MRTAEWISVGFFGLFTFAGMLLPLNGVKRMKAVGIGLTGILTAKLLSQAEVSRGGDVVRDLAPGLFLLMAYWQSGQFFQGVNPRLQACLRRLDERWFPVVARITSSLKDQRALSAYLEVAYLMCYPVVPMAIVVLYLVDRSDSIDQFWSVVLPPSYACYALTPLLQSLPPRLVEGTEGLMPRRSGPRSVNLWLLRHAGVQANTLPSGHVANSVAIALVLLKLSPVAGGVFLWIAGSIAVATATLRYHYTIDAVLGIGFALLSFSLFG